MNKYYILLFSFIAVLQSGFSQYNYWQQQADYIIDVDFDVRSDSYTGKQQITYRNNSPDTLDKVYFHLYYNAFQANSMMDSRAQNILDPERELDWKLKYLTSSEIGMMYVSRLMQDSLSVYYIINGTILEAWLERPILPGETTVFSLAFNARAPLLSRRAGRDNEEGIAYSMAQWYPKICAYDDEGWHAYPYVAREFYGNWGNFEVNIKIDSSYVLAASINEETQIEQDSSYKIWHFKASNVHDFAWAADQDYKHYSIETPEGILLHFYYQDEQNKGGAWEKAGPIIAKCFSYINKRFGSYPYPVYHIIQAGDGGMEYPMSTFITGNRSVGSIVGITLHELMHNWYQNILATNESKYAWMDEGFASFAATEIKQYLRRKGIFFGEPEAFPFKTEYKQYVLFAKSGYEEPMNTPADFFQTNAAYNMASYTKGVIFLKQLEYIVGEEAFGRGLLKYFDTWKFKHPKPQDFIRIMEKASGLELDWYWHFWINTTHRIDYAVSVDAGQENSSKTNIILRRIGEIPMPIDLLVIYKDETFNQFNIPLGIMRGSKINSTNNLLLLDDWPWTQPVYEILLNIDSSEIKQIIIDPSLRLADIDRSNNSWPVKDVKSEP